MVRDRAAAPRCPNRRMHAAAIARLFAFAVFARRDAFRPAPSDVRSRPLWAAGCPARRVDCMRPICMPSDSTRFVRLLAAPKIAGREGGCERPAARDFRDRPANQPMPKKARTEIIVA
ncbi:hypothetical protein F9948_15975 [Burkholderia thailandensis]|nr:hypothetical protein [Burkholderia thailandensis]MDD1487609.1 hypothetical protein [Burkholderia thailandensis]MDD1493252.1 hypothetical protein [Burkholderia thailandensis]